MHRKDYDDDKLIELIGSGELSSTEIAQRIGISQGLVCKIARGERRPELLPRINRAIVKRQSRTPTADSPPERTRLRLRSAGPSRKPYDDDELVRLIASGAQTYDQIGRSLGLGGKYVGKIARGECRPHLQPRIRAAISEVVNEARRAVYGFGRSLALAHIRLAMAGDKEPARKARQFLLARVLPPQPPAHILGPDTPASSEPYARFLTLEDLELLAAARGDDAPED